MSYHPKHPAQIYQGQAGAAQSSLQSAMAQKIMVDQLYTMSPIQLLVKMYDIAIEACNRKEKRKASKALIELISALNFDEEETANRFFYIYRFCLDRIKAENYDEARAILHDLRTSWVEASQMTANQTPPVNATASVVRDA